MTILRIEHMVPDYHGWQKAFDADPIDRKNSGVVRYRVCRAADNPDIVIVDLEFEEAAKAQTTLAALQQLWNRVEGTVMVNPISRIIDLVQAVEIK